jgi:hypothetical protein
MTPSDEAAFIARVKARLDQHMLDVAPELGNQLSVIRKQALERQPGEENIDHSLMLDSIANRLDEDFEPAVDIQQRLHRARRMAVARAEERDQRRPWRLVFPEWLQSAFAISGNLINPSLDRALIAAACLFVTVSAVMLSGQSPVDPFDAQQDMMLVASADELELYENLDFYLWLEENGI